MVQTAVDERVGSRPGARPRTAVLVVVVVAVLLVGAAAALTIRSSHGSNTTDADRVRALDRTLRSALVAGDIKTAELVLAPHFELIDPSGDRQTRDEYLGAVSSGELTYHAFDPISPVEVRVSGNVAVVTYESQLAVSAGDIQARHLAWHTHVYEQFGSRWRGVWSQTTAVGGFPPRG